MKVIPVNPSIQLHTKVYRLVEIELIYIPQLCECIHNILTKVSIWKAEILWLVVYIIFRTVSFVRYIKDSGSKKYILASIGSSTIC